MEDKRKTELIDSTQDLIFSIGQTCVSVSNKGRFSNHESAVVGECVHEILQALKNTQKQILGKDYSARNLSDKKSKDVSGDFIKIKNNLEAIYSPVERKENYVDKYLNSAIKYNTH
jgi:hypothetical protein